MSKGSNPTVDSKIVVNLHKADFERLFFTFVITIFTPRHYLSHFNNTFILKNCLSVEGQWSPWSPFGQCSKRCGGGIQYRSRACNNPPPSSGGKDCPGPSRGSKACNSQACSGKVTGPCIRQLIIINTCFRMLFSLRRSINIIAGKQNHRLFWSLLIKWAEHTLK